MDVLVDSTGEAFSLSYTGPAMSGATIVPRRHFTTTPSSIEVSGSSALATGNLFLRDADSIELLGGASLPAPAFAEEIREFAVPASRSLDVAAVFPPVPEAPTATLNPFAVSWTLPSSVDATVSLVQLTEYAPAFKSWAVLRRPSSTLPQSFSWKPPRLPPDLAGFAFEPPPGGGGIVRRDISADGDPFVGPFIRVAPHRYEATGISEGF
ncbi:MAG TPA: hypothetical protein VMV18_12830 [bacterium]|nr:hypothetical protein [bacterium]